MDAKSTLQTFFSHTLHKQYALRYSELLKTKNGPNKMFRDFWHVLGNRFKEEKLLSDLPKKLGPPPLWHLAKKSVWEYHLNLCAKLLRALVMDRSLSIYRAAMESISQKTELMELGFTLPNTYEDSSCQ